MADSPDPQDRSDRRWDRQAAWQDKVAERKQYYQQRAERRRLRWEARGFRRMHSGGGMVIGLMLAGIGVLLLLQNLGVLYVDDLWEFWPVILIVVGLSKVFNAWALGGRVWGGIVALVGALFLLRNLGLVHIIPWNYFWPVILIAVGVGMLLRNLDHDHPWHWDWQSHVPGGTASSASATGMAGSATGAAAGASASSTGSDFVSIEAVFSGADRRIDSQDFGGGSILALFGGVELDLSRAAITKGEVRIDANAIFGGIEIRVPDTWKVEMHGTGIFGGMTDETHPPPRTGPTPPVLIVTGSAVFGGVDVKN